MDSDSVQDKSVVELPFLEDGAMLIAVAEAVPDARSPGEVYRAFDGDIDQEFMSWWIPEQQQWQERAIAARKRLIDEHEPTERWIFGEFPGWYGTWWSQVLEFPWAARLGEAVEAAEAWLDEQ